MSTIGDAQKVFDLEIDALLKMRNSLDSNFEEVVNAIISSKGKVVFSGIGKSGRVASKLAATFSSLGIPAVFMHPTEALHGDLGVVEADDVAIILSYSGETEEAIRIIPGLKSIGVIIVGITGNRESSLFNKSDYAIVMPRVKEACEVGEAPTSSSTAQMVLGDALAVIVSKRLGIDSDTFGKNHPAGSIGKKLLIRVDDIMAIGQRNAVVSNSASLKDAILELSAKGLGIVNIINNRGELAGVITDGDLRRQLEKGVDVYGLLAKDIMTKKPKIISIQSLAVEALHLLKENNISSIPVMDGKRLVGTVRLQDIIGMGIV